MSELKNGMYHVKTIFGNFCFNRYEKDTAYSLLNNFYDVENGCESQIQVGNFMRRYNGTI